MRKARIFKVNSDGSSIEPVRSRLNTIFLRFFLEEEIKTLTNFVACAQLGEKELLRHRRRLALHKIKFGKIESKEELESNHTFLKTPMRYSLYLKGVEYLILSLQRIVENYHFKFLSHIHESFKDTIKNTPTFRVVQEKLKEKKILLTSISHYSEISRLNKLSNILKHSHHSSMALAKFFNLRSRKNLDRKRIVDEANRLIEIVPAYLTDLAKRIDLKYPPIINHHPPKN